MYSTAVLPDIVLNATNAAHYTDCSYNAEADVQMLL